MKSDGSSLCVSSVDKRLVNQTPTDKRLLLCETTTQTLITVCKLSDNSVNRSPAAPQTQMSRIFRMVSGPTRDQNCSRVPDAIVRNDMDELKRLLEVIGDANFYFQVSTNQMGLPADKIHRLEKYCESSQLSLRPLHVAVVRNNVPAIQLILSFKPDISKEVRSIRPCSVSYRTLSSTIVCSVFHLAAILNHTEAMAVLVSYSGQDRILMNRPDRYSLTPLDEAFNHLATDCAELLLKVGAGVAKDPNNASLLSICDLIARPYNNSDFRLLNLILDADYSAGGDILTVVFYRILVDEECEESVRFFDKVVRRKDFNPKQYYGKERNNYLHLAAMQHSVIAMRRLLMLGVESETNACGENVLHYAASNQFTHQNTTAVLEFITSHSSMFSCDINQKDSSGRTPLLVAIECLNTEAILFLLKAGSSCLFLPQNYTYLHVYCNSGGFDPLVLQQLAKKCDVDAATKLKWTALHFLANRCDINQQEGVANAIYELLKLGADPAAQNSAGDTVLTIAILRGLTDVIKIMLVEPPIETVRELLLLGDSQQLSALHMAVLNPNIPDDIVFDLIARGADVDACDEKGRSVLFFLLAIDVIANATNWQQQEDMFDPLLARRNMFSDARRIRKSRFTIRIDHILDHLLHTTDVNVDQSLGSEDENLLNVSIAHGRYNFAVKLLKNCASVSKVQSGSIRLQQGCLSVCILLHVFGFRDFEPLHRQVRCNLIDRFSNQTQLTRGNLLELDAFLKSCQTDILSLARLAANRVRSTYRRSYLWQNFSQGKIKDYIFEGRTAKD